MFFPGNAPASIERAEAVEAAADFQREEREAVEARAASEKAQKKRRIKAEKAAKKAQAAKLALEEAEARKAVKSNTTPRKDKAPKANDPCPYGSGKKYKKCCANKKGKFSRKPSALAAMRQARSRDTLQPSSHSKRVAAWHSDRMKKMGEALALQVRGHHQSAK